MIANRWKTTLAVVQAAAQGHEGALSELVRRYQDMVYSTVRSRVSCSEDAADLAQETFLKALGNLSSLEDGRRFGPWLRRIAENEVAGFHRRRLVRAKLTPETLVLPVPNPEERLEAEDLRERLWEAIEELPEAQREAVLLSYMGGGSQSDIAAFLGVSTSALKGRLRQARARLREKLLDRRIGRLVKEERPGREFTKRVVAGLPLVALARQEAWARWWRVGMGACAVVGAGLIGVIVQREQGRLGSGQSARPASASMVARVERGEFVAPGSSAWWSPVHPSRGQQVAIEVVGPALAQGASAGTPVLHYITDPVYPLDRTVPMQEGEDGWQAVIQVPEDASAVFFHASLADGESTYFDPRRGKESWNSLLAPYAWGFRVYGEDGHPVSGADASFAEMAAVQGRTGEAVLALWDREVARYPDDMEARHRRWYAMLRHGGDRGSAWARVEQEQAEMRRGAPDDPEILWASLVPTRSDALSQDKLATYERLYHGFPEHWTADEALWDLAFHHRLQGRHAEEVAALKELISAFPHCRYVDEAYTALLRELRHLDSGAYLSLADSLMGHAHEASWDRSLEAGQRMQLGTGQGALPHSVAFTTRFISLWETGDRTRSESVARRLLGARLPDPIPYLRIGRVLCEEAGSAEGWRLGQHLLEAGLHWATWEHMRGLPGYAVPTGYPDHVVEEFAALRRGSAEQIRQAILAALATARGRCAEGGQSTQGADL